MLRSLRSSLGPAIAERLLRRPLTYELLADYGRRAYSRRNKRAQAIWLDFTVRTLKEAFQRKRPVVWGSVFAPFELLYGLDVIPVHPETLAALAARIGWDQRALNCAGAGCYSTDVCSFYRVAMGLTLESILPPPDIIVSASCLCDGSVKFFHNMSEFYGCEHFLLDVPYHDDEVARAYLADQLKELAEAIAGRRGERPDPARLAEALRLSNEARQSIIMINALRRNAPCPLEGDNSLSYIVDMQFFGLGSRAAVDFFQTLYGEVLAGGREGTLAEGEKFRLLWLHQIRPYYPNPIMSHLVESGASVCLGESNHVHWKPLDISRPFESLAGKMLANPGVGPLERRSALAVALAREYRVDGVIHFSHWGCRQSCGGEYVIRDVLNREGIPMLILNGDGADSRNYSEEQTRLRLDAFLELLEARK